MLFNSLQFLLFFFAFFLILFSIPTGMRKIWLLIASCYFYMVFKPVYLIILIAVILIDFYAGIQIEKSKNNKRSWLILSLISNIGILVFYKYFNFLNENITQLLGYFHIQNNIPVLDIILPIGLSFHTFQAMSYTIEVYRGKQKAEKNILNYSLYVLYFPQLVAGPIERPQHLLPQLKNPIYFHYSNVIEGLFRIACGFFKKVVIADRLALFVDPVYDHIYTSNGLSVLFATIFFAFEIYCDFSGYTDIAIGVSRMMRINLVENFRNPYSSVSLHEFWGRWHISLSGWFRDYVYIPLGGNRAGQLRWIFNLLLVFFLSGLWHGARWNYVIWGLLHGSMLIIENSLQKQIKIKLPAIFKIIIVFTCVCFAWIFFRVKVVDEAFTAIGHILHLSINNDLPNIFNSTELIFSFLLITGLLFTETVVKITDFKNHTLIMSITLILFLLSYFLGEFNFKQFIYFQF
jgi:D-alanyl-lipoteichoic acid acyltransferase DltB (MBOAT superfamily)